MSEVNVAIISEMKAFLGLASSEFHLHQLFCSDPARDFCRQRKLTLDRVALFIARLCKRTLSLELERFFADLNASAGHSNPPAAMLPCSLSAYCQQRKKLHPCFFRLWNDVLCNSFYYYRSLFNQPIKTWKRLRVIAADGSSVGLVPTPGLQNHFGGHSNQLMSCCLARTFYYYDVLNGLIVDSLIAPYRSAELSIAYGRIDGLADDSVTVYDRNFCSWKMMALHLWAERPKRFVIRGRERHLFVRQFLASGKEEAVVELSPDKDAIIQMRQAGLVVTGATSIRVRLVRVILPRGGVEVLVTNLMSAEGYAAAELGGLYFLRWGVETSIDFQKNTLMLEAFSGQSVVSIEQDFYATVLLANLQMCLMSEAQATLDGAGRGGRVRAAKYPVQVNRNKASARLREWLVALFWGADPVAILQRLHGHFIRDVLPLRKGRQYERKRKSNRRVNAKHRAYTNYKMA